MEEIKPTCLISEWIPFLMVNLNVFIAALLAFIGYYSIKEALIPLTSCLI